MNEEAVKLGNGGGMVGILSSGTESAKAPVALMFNAGFLHRVGPFRMWVDLARELALKNIPSLRFDLSGLGDSQPAGSGEAAKRAVDDLIAAMDLVESRLGKREFIIFGLCSGADYGHPALKADARIRGAAFVDAYGYKTPSYYVNHQLLRVTSLRRWKNLVVRNLGLGKVSGALAMPGIEVRDFPDVNQVQADINAFLQQGRRLFFIYTAGVPEYFNHENQFWDMFPKVKRQPGLCYQFFAKTDHTFALVTERKELTRQLVEFVADYRTSPSL